MDSLQKVYVCVRGAYILIFLMILSDYKQMNEGLSPAKAQNIVVCEGYFVGEKDRLNFISQHFEEASVKLLCKQRWTLYGSIGFPLSDVEEVLSSQNQMDFLYILFNSPFNIENLIYDEFVFKNFPMVVKLLKLMRAGGDIFIFKKDNADVLFVKILNIYDGTNTVRMELK